MIDLTTPDIVRKYMYDLGRNQGFKEGMFLGFMLGATFAGIAILVMKEIFI